MRGGWIWPDISTPFRSAGSDGYYWSSWASSTTLAYILDFGTSVNPSYFSDRYIGRSLRCLIPTT